MFETKQGDTFVTREELLDGELVTRYFAVYEMLSGEDKYTWIKNRCTDAEYENGGPRAGALPPGRARLRPRRPVSASSHPSWTSSRPCLPRSRGTPPTAKGTKYDKYFLAKLPEILESIDRGLTLAPELEGLPRCPVFCDYHPGNLKWVDEKSVGLFDFDWAKLDYRLFDIAIGIVYFCTSWEDTDDGELRLDKAEIFLKAYQDEASRTEAPGPLTGRRARARCPACWRSPRCTWSTGTIVAYYMRPQARTTTSTSSSSSTTWRSWSSSRPTSTSSPPWPSASGRSAVLGVVGAEEA